MARELVKDFYGKILGSLETQSNGDIIARDFYGKILGRYDKQMNVTKDFLGKILTQGNITSGLIWEASSKR
jgi:extradiol dioxygenase family protein